KNGAVITGATGPTLALSAAGNGDHGDAITLAVTPAGGATVVSPAATVADSGPAVSVALSPASPKTNQTLTATSSVSDLDADPVTLTYVWRVNGTTVKTTSGTSLLTDTLDLSQAGNGDRGQTISVTVTPTDRSLAGTAATHTQ